MRKYITIIALLIPTMAHAADKDAWYAKAVKSVEATVEPAEAKPGTLVLVKLTVSLHDGYHTYPLEQLDPQAADMINKWTFPTDTNLIFVGSTFDPAQPKKKAEPVLGIKEMLYYTGTMTYERRAVVSPKAMAGALKVQIPEFRLSVCDKDNCFPAKKLTPELSIKVLDGPAVEVPAKYAAEVEKALKGK